MNPNVRIITDDFTSATDGTAGFAKHGFASEVAFGNEPRDTAEVVAVDTDSRAAAPEEAVDQVYRWARRWAGARYLVKQFDSTLRGHVARECAAALQAGARSTLLLAPAFPDAGRTTVGGVVLVDGVPVHRTAFGSDPLNPVLQSDLHALFAEAGIRIERAENAEHAERLFAESQAVCVDVRREEELDALVRRAVARPESWQHVLWGGSTGLLRAMSRVLSPVGAPQRLTVPRAGRPAVVVGSLNPLSRVQLRELRRHRELPFEVVATSERRGNPRLCGQALARRVEALFGAGRCDALVVTGGDTARQVARALGVSALRVADELQPGVAVCVAEAFGRSFPFVTKAGGFGRDQVLAHCVRYLVFGVHPCPPSL